MDSVVIKRKYLLIGIAAAIIIVIPSLYYVYDQYQKMYTEYKKTKLQLSQSSSVIGEVNTKEIIDKVSKLIELPKEAPTIATVTDAGKLKDQPFFLKAQNGDKVLIFQKAKKAILYREGINKIIDVAPVNINEPTPSVSPIPTVTPTRVPSPTSVIVP